MFLRSLTLKGFKSFADATTLTCEPGVTVVVGPNGSGKSNVVDAIAWVLGAQAPSAVRSQKMDDVIFAGTATRPALGRAEVALTIDNSAGLLPIEFTEVTLARTLWRSGESEYAINGVPCRLLDVQELLSDSGVGRQQHVIVSQGQIDAVLNARPEERRAIIEEAAGVLKFRRRKEKAERRLEATEGNLLRVQDLLREVRRQLRPLERQAEAARRHGEVLAELTALKVHLAGRELTSLRTRQTGLAGQRAELSAAETELRRRLAALDTDVLAAEARLGASGAADVSDELVGVGQLRERARGLSAVLAERRRSIERDRVLLLDASVTAALDAEAADLRRQLAGVEHERVALVPEAAAVTEAEAELAAHRADGDDDVDEAGGSRPSAAGAAAEVRGELRTRRAGCQRDEAEALRVDQRRGELADRAGRLTSEAERARTECERLEAAEQPLVEAMEAAEARRVAAEAAAEVAGAAHQDGLAEAAKWSARAEALVLALDAARARAGAERLVGVDGVLGALVDLVEVDAGWEAAFEAAAGDALAAVVVNGPDAARSALTHLAEAGAGGGIVALGADLPARSTPPVGERVRDHVHCGDPAVARLLDGLVGHAVGVRGGWTAAVDAAIAYPGAVVVTLGGDRFATTWRLGQDGVRATAAALREAEQRLEAARRQADERDLAARRARALLDAARTQETEAARRLDGHDARFTAAAEAFARARAELRDVVTEVDALDAQRDELAKRIDHERARIVELEGVHAGLEAEETAEAEAARVRAEARARFETRAAAVAARRRDLAVRAAGLDERHAFIERRLAEVEARLQTDAEARERAEDERLRLDNSLIAVERLSAYVDARHVRIDRRLTTLHEERRHQTDEARAAAARLDALRHDRADAERALEEVRERSRRRELEDTEVRMRMEAAVEALRRELDTEPEVAMAAPAPDLPEGTTAAARAREVERELRLMGPINPLALEEFTALQGRHRFLEEQLDDVRESRRELTRVIRAIDAEIQQVFAAAYADVADNFGRLFTTLFPGGTGRLSLTEPENLLDTGIEIEAKPSGKNIRKLSLLSGGERSLTALAYLFAVFRSRPSPFYVMDEVEAALDDVNLHRFLDLVREFREDAQLLVVSHQKRTMEAADCLVGVSMHPGGSSKIITERIGVEVSR
jgi:chromosome segregation protein